MTELPRNLLQWPKPNLSYKSTCKGKMMQESDIPNLRYLQAVMKETLRLHPAAPFLPKISSSDVKVDGFVIPKDSLVFINSWAISRDPKAWTDPESFKPERFLEGSIDFRRQHFEYLPFGGGRRICPGMPLATRIGPLMLGSLIHSFDWKLPGGMKPEDIDMNDKFGISLPKAVPMRAIPLPVQQVC